MKNSLDKENTTKFWDAARAMHQAAVKENRTLKNKDRPKSKKNRLYRM